MFLLTSRSEPANDVSLTSHPGLPERQERLPRSKKALAFKPNTDTFQWSESLSALLRRRVSWASESWRGSRGALAMQDVREGVVTVVWCGASGAGVVLVVAVVRTALNYSATAAAAAAVAPAPRPRHQDATDGGKPAGGASLLLLGKGGACVPSLVSWTLLTTDTVTHFHSCGPRNPPRHDHNDMVPRHST